MSVGGCQDLNHVAVLNLRSQRDHATVDARAGAGVTYFGVDHVGEVNGRRAARQLDNFAHRREGVNVFRVQIEFE